MTSFVKTGVDGEAWLLIDTQKVEVFLKEET
jgi:hypothetical protein